MSRPSLKLTPQPEEEHAAETYASPYKLVLSNSMRAELQENARQQRRTLLDLIRRYLGMGLYIDKVQSETDAEIIVRRPGRADETLRFL